MALEDTTGGLEAVDPQIKATMPKTGGLSLAGQKGVSLNPADSTEIRSRLMQMIQQREEAASGWGPIMERAAVSAGAPGTFAQNLQSFGTNQRNKEKELFDMRVGLAQLNTEEARIKQAQELAAQNQLNFTNAMRADQGLPPLPSAPQAGGMAPAPQDGAAPAPQAGAAPTPARPSNITPTQMAMLQQMYADPSTRAEAQKQYFALTKQDDIVRRLRAAGVQEGSPTWNQMLALNVAGASAFAPHDVRGVGGTGQQTPFGAVGATLGTTPPTAPAPTPVAAPTAGAAPVTPAAAPAPVAAAPAPTQGSPFAPGTKEDLEWRQKQAGVNIAGDTKEAEKMAETFAAEQGSLRAAVDAAPTNILLANQVMQDVKEHKELFAKLNQPSLGSALAGLMKSGIQIGQFGSISVPGINDFLQQVDPGAKDNPKRLEAWTRITASMAQINLDYAQRVMKGQGAVSNFERELVERAVGDINRDSARNMMVKMKMLEIASYNAQQINDKWEVAQKAGQSWQQFKSSPAYKEMKREQYYNTAKTMQIKNPPKYPGEA